jgi:hypothetical protein
VGGIRILGVGIQHAALHRRRQRGGNLPSDFTSDPAGKIYVQGDVTGIVLIPFIVPTVLGDRFLGGSRYQFHHIPVVAALGLIIQYRLPRRCLGALVSDLRHIWRGVPFVSPSHCCRLQTAAIAI